MGKAENAVEQALVDTAHRAGFECFKFISGESGVPDRILVGAGQVVFIELKAPGQKLRDQQKRVISRLHDQSVIALAIDDPADAELVVQAVGQNRLPELLERRADLIPDCTLPATDLGRPLQIHSL